MKRKHGQRCHRRRVRSSRRHIWKNPRQKSRLAFESLEVRALLAADTLSGVLPGSSALGLDLLLQVDSQSNTLQLVDLANPSQVIQESGLASNEPFVIQGSAAADRLQIDFLSPFTYQGGIYFEAFGGRDEVQLSTNGLDAFALAGAETSGTSFSAQFGANNFTTTGLEFFEQQGPIQSASLTGTNQADAWTVAQRNDQQLEIQGLGGFGTTILLETPTAKLALRGQGGDDYISIFDVQLDLVEFTVAGGTGDDTIELTDVQAARSDFVIAGGAGSDTLLIDRNALSRTNVDFVGGPDDDTLLVTGNELDRSDLLVQGGWGHDSLTLDSNLLSRSDLVTLGGTAIVTTEYAADFDLDGDVDADDYAKWKSDYGQNAESDANGDGLSNAADYVIWRNTLGSGADDDAISVRRLQLELSSAEVRGGHGADRIAIDEITGTGLSLDGGRGIDTLSGPSAGALWIVTGHNLGTVEDHPFDRFEHLIGADHQSDVFIVGPEGDAAGIIDGGRDGDDSLLVEDHGHGPHVLMHTMTGPQSGTFASVDGDVAHDHFGFESVELATEADSQTIELTAGANLTLTQDADGNVVTTIQHAFDVETDLSGLDGIDGFVVVGAGTASGQSVQSAGDINDDGIDDFIIGAPDVDRVYVIFGTATGFSAEFDPASLDGTNGFVLSGATGQNTGYAVGGRGDVNGDGIDDIVVGAPGPEGAFAAGTSYVVFGRDTSFSANIDLTALEDTDGFVLEGVDAGDASGFSVAVVRDVNGDQIDEVLIGAPGADPDAGRVDAGQAYLVMGSDKPFSPVISLSSLDGVTGFALSGAVAGDQVGFSVADTGDINTDGVGDVVIGAPGADPNGDGSGAAYVFFGAGDFIVAGGLSATFYDSDPVATLADAQAVVSGNLPTATFDAYKIDYPNTDDTDSVASDTLLADYLGLNAEFIEGGNTSSIDGSVFLFDGNVYVPAAGTYTFEVGATDGFSLIIDGETVAAFDGVRDFATASGTRAFNSPGFFPISLVHFTSSEQAGIELKSDLTGELALVTRDQLFTNPPVSNVALDSLDGTNGFVIHGAAAGDALGTAVGHAGDTNGDGPDDVIVGAPGADVGGEDSGQAVVILGKPLTFVDGDQFEPVYERGSLDGTDGFLLQGAVAGSRAGSAVGTAGDLNADNADDVFLGAPGTTGGSLPGSVLVVFGNAEITSASAFDLGDLDGVTGFVASSGTPGDLLGVSAAAAGDVNGDGFDDLVLGSSANARVLFGREVGGAGTSIAYALPASEFVIDGEDFGARITIGAASAPSGLVGGGASQDVNLNGANFRASGQSITVEEGVAISTREITGDDNAEAVSIGDSGSITLKAVGRLTDGVGSVTIKEGAALYAQVEEGSVFRAGDISVSASHQTEIPSLPIAQLISEGARTAQVVIDQGVAILGGDVDIGAAAGIVDLESKMQASAGGLAGLGTLAVLTKYLQLFELPVSVQVSIVNSTIEIGEEGGDEVRIEGSENVTIEADAAAEARGNAIFWVNPFSPGSSWGLAFGLWIANSTSKVTLHDAVTVESTEGNVKISADSSTKAGGDARVSQNLSQGLGSDDNTIPANPNNAALSIGLAFTNTTAKVIINEGASVIADVGNVAIAADGEDEVKVYPETRSYEKGRFGVSFGFMESTDDIRALVNGVVRAGGSKAGSAVSFDPFTTVDSGADAIDLGSDHGYETGDKVVYSPDLGSAIDGLQRLGRYYVIVDQNDANLVRLAATREDAENGVGVDLIDNPSLASVGENRSLPFTDVGSETDWIDFGFAHGFADGEALVYTAALGKRIGGLANGATYYAVLLDAADDPDGTRLQLATDSAGQNIVDLDTDITITVQGTGQDLVVDSVDAGPGTITFTTEHGLSSGDAIAYNPALGFRLTDGFTEEPFTDGMVFYAIPSPSPDDSSQLDPFTIRLARTADDATSSNGYTNSVDFRVDQSIMIGTTHILEPAEGSGITVSAAMSGKHSGESKARIGGAESFTKKWSRPEFSNPATLFRQGMYNRLNNPQLNNAQNSNLPNGVNGNTGQDSLDFSAAVLYQDVDRTVEVVIGSQADLESGTDVLLSADAEEYGNMIVEAGASQSADQGIKREIGAAFSLATYTTTVRAVVNGGAHVDASGDLDVEAENVRSFPVEVDSPENFRDSILEEVEANPLGFIGDLNKSLLHPFFTTGWTYTRAAPVNADTSVGFAVQIASYDNTTQAIIANGALINQDENFRTDEQSVRLDALTEMHVVDMAGVFEIGLGIGDAITAFANKARELKKKSNVLPEVGVEGKNVAVGTSFQWTDVDNTTVAAVGEPSPVDDSGDKADSPSQTAPALVHSGKDGKLTVNAHEELWFFGFVDTGAKTESGSFAFAGSGSVMRHNFNGGEVRSSIAAGTQATGGSVDVDASDELILVSQNGSFITGNNARGVGVGVNYWEIHRKVHAFIGSADGSSTEASDIQLDTGSTIDVTADSDGFAVSFALASDKRTETAEQQNPDGQVAGPNPVDANAPDGSAENAVGQGANAGQSGWSLAADVNYVDLQSDKVWAFIDDVGTFEADEVTVSASNDNSYINLAGALAIANPDVPSSSNTGLAGSFSGIGLTRGSLDSLSRGDSDTLAYIRRATLDIGAGGLDITAHRRGTYWVTAVGGAGVSRGEGFEAAGSAAWTDLNYATKAYVEDVPSLMLAGDSTIEATDRVATVAVAGDVVWNGSIGFGTSWAWNHVDRRIHATVDTSTITQSAGELNINAVLWDVSADDGQTLLPNAYAVAGTLGKGNSQTNAELTGTVAVNEFNSDTSADAVRASMDSSSYTSTATADSNQQTNAGLSLVATDNSNLLAFAGGIDLGAKFTLGVAAAVNELDDQAVARIENSTVEVNNSDVIVQTNINPEMNAFALGVAVSDTQSGVDFAGSGASNRTGLTADAHILGTVDPTSGETDTSISGAGNISVDASITYTDVAAGAGEFGVQSFENLGDEFGAAVAVNFLAGTDVKAYVKEAVLTANDDISVAASTGMATDGILMALAVGLERADDFALGGSVSKNNVGVTTDAHVSGSKTTLSAGRDVAVVAQEKDLVVAAGAGVVSGISTAVAVGAAVPTNVVDTTVKSYVEDAAVTSGRAVTVAGERKNPQVVAVALGGEGAQSFALGGSVATNDVTHKVDAHISGGNEVKSDGSYVPDEGDATPFDITVKATEDSPTIVAAAGNFSEASKGIAIGAAIPTNTVKRELRAYVGNKDGDSFTNDGADGASLTAASGIVEVSATRTDSFVLAVGVSGIGADTFSLGGSAATNNIETSTVDAHVWGGTLDGTNGVTIRARDAQATQAVGAGNLDLSYLVQASGGSANNSVVDGREFVDDGGQDAVNDGVGAPEIDDEAANVDAVQGQMEDENPVDEAQNNANSLNEFQENLNDNIDIEEEEALNAGLPIVLSPGSDSNAGAIETGAAEDPLGASAGASVGIALANNLATDSTVIAFASDATLNSDNESIEIDATQNALLVTVAGSGSVSQGGVTIDATEATTDYQPKTTAYIDAAATSEKSTVTVGGNVLVDADAKLHAVTVAGNIAISASGQSVALSAAALNHTDTTQAWIDNADVTAFGAGAASTIATGQDLDYATDDQFHGISVTADSEEVITTVAAGIDLGTKSANRAASVSINLLDETTTAKILSNTTLNQDNTGAGANQEINVFAWSDTVVHGGGGAIGLSGGGTWGGGASADAGNITKTTIAALESSTDDPTTESNTANANGNIAVQALSLEKVSSYEGTVEVSRGLEVAATAGIYLFDLTTKAYVGVEDGSKFSSIATNGSLLVAADDVTRTHLFVGSVALSLGGSASVGASFGDVHISKHTSAKIHDGATVTAKGHSTTDAISAASGGFDVTFDDPDGDLTEVQPPGIVTNDLVGLGASPTNDQAYTKTRHSKPTLQDMRGVAVTATGRDVVKGVTFSGGGFATSNVDTAILVRTGTTNTTASIDGDVTASANDSSDADQDVLVSASHDYHQLAVAGGLAVVGKFSVTPAVSWSVTNLNTTASIGDGASVTSAADTLVVAKGSEHLTVVTAGFAAGSVLSFDAQVVVDALTTTVTADVGHGATVDADGNVLVSAKDNTHATHVAGGAAVSIGAESAGVGASFIYFDVDKTTSATIAGEETDNDGNTLNAATVDARANSGTTIDALDGAVSKNGDFPTHEVQGVVVQAQSLDDVQNYAISGAISLYAGVGGSILYTHISSDTNAEIGDGANINQSDPGTPNDNQSVSVAAANDASVSNIAGGIAAGIIALEGAVDVGLIRNNTTAAIGNDVSVDAANDVDVHAVARRNVNSIAVNSADGALGIGGSVSAWTIGKKLKSTYDTVSTTDNDSLQFRSDSDSGQSPAYADFGAYGDGQANRTDATAALSSYDTDDDSPEGAVAAANVGTSAANEMVLATPESSVSDAIVSNVNGKTTTTIGTSSSEDAGVTAGGDISVTSAERTDLTVFTGTFSLDIVGFGASVSTSQVRGEAIAHADGRLFAGGNIEITSESNSDLDNNAYIVQAAGGSVAAAVAITEDHSVQAAYLEDGAEVLAAESVNVTANRDFDKFKSDSLVVELAIVELGASVAQAKVFGSTSAYAGDVSIPPTPGGPQVGSVTITATSRGAPSAQAVAGAAGLIAGDGNRADATVTPTVDAHFGSGTSHADAHLYGDLTITANSSAEPEAQGYGIGVGGITVGVSLTSATASPTVSAYVADNAQVNLPGDGDTAQVGKLAVQAITLEDPTSHGRASGGAVIAGFGVDSKTHINPVVEAYIGADANIQANLDVLVKAEDTWAGTTVASGQDYGVLTVSQNNATAEVQPQVSAYISAKQVVSDHGAVSVIAESGEPGSLPELSFDPAKIDYTNNIITFNLPHGLETGDTVIYDPGDQAVVGGLEPGESYLVERISDTEVKFVYQFDSADVDPETSQIYSNTPHGIETGAPVIYDNNGLANIDNLTGGQTYYVSAVDPHNLRLATSQEIADNLHETTFDIPSAVNASANEIQLKTSFAGVGHRGHANNNEHHIRLDTAPGWSDGQEVYYFASDDEVISDLTLGEKYYAFADNDSRNYTITTDPAGNDRVEFSSNRNGNFVTPTSSWRAGSEGIDSPESQFTWSNVDGQTDTITFTSQPPISHGDVVGFESIFGIGPGLSKSIYYYADVNESGENTQVRLALSQADLNNGVFLDLVDGFGTDQVFALTRPFTVTTGDALTYRAPLEVRFTSADIQNGKVVVQLDKAPTLYQDLVAFDDAGDVNNIPRLTYDIVSTFDGAEPLDQLIPGQSYDFDVSEDDSFTLTIELTGISLSSGEDPNSTTPVDHVLRMQGHDAIVGLDDGNAYYMIVTSTPGLVKLAESQADALAGQAVDLAVAGNMIRGDFGGSHFLGLEGIGIAPPTSGATGIQQLTIDLSDSGATGTHNFVQAGSTEDVDTITGSPTVKAHGTNGDVVGGLGTQADATVQPIIQAFVGDPAGADTPVDITITAADFLLTSTSNAYIKAESIGYDVSLLAGGGAAFSTVSMLNTATTYVGAGTSVQVTGDANILANSTESVDAKTDMVAGGALDVSITEADVNIGRATTVTLGAGSKSMFVAIDSGGTTTVAATSSTGSSATSKAHAYGGTEIAVPHVEAKIGHGNYPAATEVVLGDYAAFTAGNLQVAVLADHTTLNSHANARTGDLFGGSNVDSQMLVEDHANLTIGQQVTSTTTNGKTVDARLSFGDVIATSNSKARTLVGGDYAAATTSLTGGVTLDGQFADSANDYLNYSLDLGTPTSLVGRHESRTYYIWFIRDKKVGHNASNDTSVDIVQTPATSAALKLNSGQVVVSPDMLPLAPLNGGTRSQAFAALDSIDTLDRTPRGNRLSDEISDFVFSRWNHVPLRSGWRPEAAAETAGSIATRTEPTDFSWERSVKSMAEENDRVFAGFPDSSL